MKKYFTLILLALLPVVANAYDAEIDGIYYNFSGSEATVTHWNPYTGSVNIPSSVTYKGMTYSVTSIGDSAFSSCDRLTDVYCLAEELPETSYYAFNNSPIASATLHVPASALEDYRTTEPWSGFGTIVALTEDEADGIRDLRESKDFRDSWHSLDGRRLSAPQQGINIVRYSDGTTRKVLVK